MSELVTEGKSASLGSDGTDETSRDLAASVAKLDIVKGGGDDDGDDDDGDDEEEDEGAGAQTAGGDSNAAKKKKKKKKGKKKKKPQQALGTQLPKSRLLTGFTDYYIRYGQTEVPSRPVADLFPQGGFPEGEIQEHGRTKHTSSLSTKRVTEEEKRLSL